MNVLIVEDEAPAVDHLLNLFKKQKEEINVIEHLDSVKSAVKWFKENKTPDLAFFDIQLADGKSFEIFEKAQVDCPIIFTTAYDNFALKAFQVNSIDYLLKPVSETDLSRAINKFTSTTPMKIDMEAIQSLLGHSSKKYKEQFLIKVGEHLRTILVGDVELFYSEDRSTYLHTGEGKKFILDYTLDQVDDMIDPAEFFRINRKFIVKMNGIQDMVAYSNSRLKLTMKSYESAEMIVSRERVGEFKSWLDR